MKKNFLLVGFILIFLNVKAQQLIQGTIKKGAGLNEIEVWLKPDFSNNTQYLFQIGLPISWPASAANQPTTLTVTLDPGFTAAFGNNYSVTVNPIANNTGNTERYFNIVLIRGGAGASNPQTWTAGAAFKVLSAAFAPDNAPGTMVKLADYQDGGSDGQGNFYTQDGNSNYYVTAISTDNFYAMPGESTAGGTVSAGYSQTANIISLPVSLVSFSGYRNGTINTLNWTTASEENNKGFEVQRSADGINYSVIGFVNPQAANGNSSSMINYSFTDAHPIGKKQYYRLRQVDIDNRSALSKIIMIINDDKPLSLKIGALFPNPAVNQVSVTINVPARDKITWMIIDLNGKIVKQQTVDVEEGTHTMDVAINELIKGSYWIRVISNKTGGEAVSRFVKQ